jgi:hypothetical protein
MFCEEELAELTRLRDQGFWVKPTTEGPEGLLRALSNAIYFTETLHASIQKEIIEYFDRQSGLLGEAKLFPCEETLASFRQSPSLPEFESVNLEIASRLFAVEITLMLLDGRRKVFAVPDGPIGRRVFLVKLLENRYLAAYDLGQESIAILSQNIILSAIESAVSKSAYVLYDFNNGIFLNFDLENWRKASGLVDHTTHLDIDYRQNLYLNNFCSKCDRDGSLSVSDQQSRVVSSNDSVGSVILAILESRRKNNPYGKVAVNLEQKLENFLASSDNNGSFNANFESVKPNRAKFTENQSSNFEVFNEPLQCERPILETYSNVISGMNDNLNKPVVISDLNSIFNARASSQKKHTLNIENFVRTLSGDQEDDEEETEEIKVDSRQSQPLKNVSSPNSVTDCLDKTHHELSAFGMEESSEQRHFGREGSARDFGTGNSIPTLLLEIPGTRSRPANVISSGSFVYSQATESHSSKIKPVEAQEFSQKESEDIDETSEPNNWYPDSQTLQYHPPHNQLSIREVDPSNFFMYRKGSHFTNGVCEITESHSQNLGCSNFSPNNSKVGRPTKADLNSIFTQLPARANPSQTDTSIPKGNPNESQGQTPNPSSEQSTLQKKKRYREKLSKDFHTGFLKFFDEAKGYDFVTVTDREKPFDVFVYRNELQHANVEPRITRKVKKVAKLFLRFRIAKYSSKNGNCKKALNIEVVDLKLP